MAYSHHLAERTLNLFARKPFTVFFRVFVLTFAVQKQEFWYLVLFIIGVGIWIMESVALYIDPKLAQHLFMRLANFLFVILAISAAILHLGPKLIFTASTIAPLVH